MRVASFCIGSMSSTTRRLGHYHTICTFDFSTFSQVPVSLSPSPSLSFSLTAEKKERDLCYFWANISKATQTAAWYSCFCSFFSLSSSSLLLFFYFFFVPKLDNFGACKVRPRRSLACSAFVGFNWKKIIKN